MSIVLSSKTTDFVTTFSSPLLLGDEEYELGLVSLETYNSISNVTPENNKFRYSIDATKQEFSVEVSPGCYEIDDIMQVVRKSMKTFGHWDTVNDSPYVDVRVNYNTFKANLYILNADYEVNFAHDGGMADLFGFEKKVYTVGKHVASKVVNILSTNTILVHCDVITHSYYNGLTSPIIYAFFPNVAPGFKIVETPTSVLYLPIKSQSKIHEMRIWLTDQDEKPIDLNGETFTVRFSLRRKTLMTY
jgi:hypothetical protein